MKLSENHHQQKNEFPMFNGKEVFYIRVQNSTIALSPKESTQYIKRRW